MISIKKASEDLDRLAEMVRAAKASYNHAVWSASQYTVEIDTAESKQFREHLERIRAQADKAEYPEDWASVQASFRGELRDHRDRSLGAPEQAAERNARRRRGHGDVRQRRRSERRRSQGRVAGRHRQRSMPPATPTVCRPRASRSPKPKPKFWRASKKWSTNTTSSSPSCAMRSARCMNRSTPNEGPRTVPGWQAQRRLESRHHRGADGGDAEGG